MVKEVNVPVKGMNQDVHPSQMDKQGYVSALNANIANTDGSGQILVQNEHSNVLCDELENFLVLGIANDLNNSRTFYLGLDQDGISQVIVITNDCEKTTLLSDCTEAEDRCLNFDQRHPIDIVIKQEKCGTVLYFTDGKNPRRRLEVDRISQYYTKEVKCDDCECGTEEIVVCLNCEKMLVQKPFAPPTLKFKQLYQGGRLKQGIYYFFIAYSDGNRVVTTRYMSPTGEIPVKDTNRQIYDPTNLDAFTNLGIQLEIENLDFNYTHYRVVGVEITAVDGAQKFFEVGNYPISTKEIFVDSSSNKLPVAREEIATYYPTYLTARRLKKAFNKLYYTDLTEQKDVNLQPVLNFVGEFVTWRYSQAPKASYAKPEFSEAYKAYMRDEVYPLGIRVITNTGYVSPLYPLIGRKALSTDKYFLGNPRNGIRHNSDENAALYIAELLDAAPSVSFANNFDKDVLSVLKNAKNCDNTDRIFKWQFYNTASVIGNLDCGDSTIEIINQVTLQSCESTVEKDVVFEEVEVNIADFTTIDDYLESQDISGLEIECCELTVEGCEVSESPLKTERQIVSIDDTDIEVTFGFEDCSTTPTLTAPLVCDMYNLVGGEPVELTGVGEYIGATSVGYERLPITPTSITTPTILPFIIPTTFQLSYFLAVDEADALTSIDADDSVVCASPLASYLGEAGCEDITTTDVFKDKIHKGAAYYRVNTPTTNKIRLELSPKSTPLIKDCFKYAQRLRVSILDDTNTIIETHCISVSTGSVLCVETPNTNFVTVIIDSPLITPTAEETKPYVAPLHGCITITAQEIPANKVIINGTAEYTIKQTCTYSVTCPIETTIASDCAPVPRVEGKFGYHESIINYPNNSFLYDSSQIVVRQTDLPTGIRTHFGNTFSSSVDDDGRYILTEDTNFACKPIRHFRFPDHSTAPIFTEIKQDLLILGVHIDNEIIKAFLDIAVNNDLITQEFRDSIIGYEVFRGDATKSPSIIGKGLLYDTIAYQTAPTEPVTLLPNFPFNDKFVNHPLISLTKATTKSNDEELLFTPLPHNSFNNTGFSSFGNGNNRYTFHSPEFHFNNPILPFELKVESNFYGLSNGSSVPTKQHPLFTLLTKRARNLAYSLGFAEVTLEVTIETIKEIAKAGKDAAYSSSNPIAAGAAGVGLAAYILAVTGFFLDTAKKSYLYSQQWLEILERIGQPRNYAATYTAIGNYNRYTQTGITQGQTLRGLTYKSYLQPQRFNFRDDNIDFNINNRFRESSLLLSTGNDLRFYLQNTPVTDRSSSQIIEEEPLPRDASSYYVSLKNYSNSQYGNIFNIQWIDTGYYTALNRDNSCDVIYGGDIFLSEFTLKRKHAFFESAMLDHKTYLPNNTPFNYTFNRNDLYPRYYLNFRTQDEDTNTFLGSNLPLGYLTDFNLNLYDKGKRGNLYVVEPARFFFQIYGIARFIVETRINLDYRYAQDNLGKGFYPMVGDENDWTQEYNVSIREDNTYFYNDNYSREQDIYAVRLMPETYNPEVDECRLNLKDRVIYSQASNDVSGISNNTQNLTDPWQIYKALDYYDFGVELGDIVGLLEIDDQKVLGRFENGIVVFGASDTLKTDKGLVTLGAGDLFRTRPQILFKSELGYGGTQHYEIASSPFGHFWTDAKRGKVFQIGVSGSDLDEVSRYGMLNWFRENLPFQILKDFPNLPNQMLDHPKKGLGITMTYDERFSRIIITKKDKRLKELREGESIVVIDHDFYLLKPETVDTLIDIEDDEYFEDVSWTIAYHPLTKSWISFYSFLPNYYVPFNGFFKSGRRDKGLWKHDFPFDSYQTFYDDIYPFQVEVPLKMTLAKNVYDDVEYKLDVRKYENTYDYLHKELNFNKAFVYNNRETTGNLDLVTAQRNNLFQYTNYPQYNANSIGILVHNEDDTWRFNHFYNIVLDTNINPIITHNLNRTTKNPTLAANTLDYTSRYKNYFRGQWANIVLTQDTDTLHKYIFEYLIDSKTQRP